MIILQNTAVTSIKIIRNNYNAKMFNRRNKKTEGWVKDCIPLHSGEFNGSKICGKYVERFRQIRNEYAYVRIHITYIESSVLLRCWHLDLSLLQVQATDPDCGVNAMVNYTLAGGRLETEQLLVRSDTGDICVRSPLDRETAPYLELPVIATDRGLCVTLLFLLHDYYKHKPSRSFRQNSYDICIFNFNEIPTA